MTTLNNDQNPPSPPAHPGRRFIVLGLVVLWIASLAFVLEILNLTVVKKFQVSSDPSLEMIIAAFCLLLTLLGALLIWRGDRENDGRPKDRTQRYLNLATVATILALAITTCSGGLVFSANRAFLAQQTTYIRPAPQPDYSLTVFPTPNSPQPTPTFDPAGKYLAGTLIGSIDHLSVGSIWISESPDDQAINYVQLTIQPVECTVQQNGLPYTFAVKDSQPWIDGPLRVQNGIFYANLDTTIIHGEIVSPEEIMGTLYLRYTDPKTGQSCDLGTFEYDAFVTESGKK